MHKHPDLAPGNQPDAVLPGRPFRVALRLNVAPGWHIYAHSAANSALVPTIVDITSDAPLEDLEITYPEGVPLGSVPAGEQPAAVYEGRPIIFANLEVRTDWRPGDQSDGRVHLRIRYRCQPCDDTACLAPTEGVETLSIPVITEENRRPREINEEIFKARRRAR